ncbi:hypothetical protein MauCBS54593_000183, partial [Microsporum audouinii]
PTTLSIKMQFSAFILLGLASAVSARPFSWSDLFKFIDLPLPTTDEIPIPTGTTFTIIPTGTGTGIPTGTGTGIPIPTGTGTLPYPTGTVTDTTVPSGTYHWPTTIPTPFI